MAQAERAKLPLHSLQETHGAILMVTYCMLCTHLIPEKRHRKCSRTCSKECQKQYRLERVQERRQKLVEAASMVKPKQRASGEGISDHASFIETLDGGFAYQSKGK